VSDSTRTPPSSSPLSALRARPLGPTRAAANPSDLAVSLDRWTGSTTFAAPGTPLTCAVSGGADSLAMLALSVAAGCDVTAVHVDHGRRAGSHSEADVVAAAATAVGAAFRAEHVVVEDGSNLEARMRAARYAILGAQACTGHTMDDQAETVLLNLMRGAGLAGLGAMQPGPRRPILALRRADTEAICAALGWEPVVDPSNIDPAFTRNRVRHEVLPLLSEIARRDVVPLIARSAGHSRSASTMVDALAAELDPTDANELSNSDPLLAARAIQMWIRESTGSEHPVDQASIDRVLGVVAGDAVAAEVAGGWRVSRSGRRLGIS